MAKYKAQSEHDRCVACGVCVKVCPKDAVSIYRGCYAVVNEDLCIGCGICEKVCPAGAITINENLSHIDENYCLSCGQCAVKCPRGAIAVLRGILTD